MTIQVFDVGEITINFDASNIYDSWEESMRDILDDEEFVDLDGVGGNRQFCPLEPIGITALEELSRIESQQISDIQTGNRTISDINDAEEELWENERYEPYMILDVGVRTLVMALLEIGSEPFSSCNGGSFSNDVRHAESYPLIAMYGPNDTLSIIEKAAKKHACGLYGTGGFGGKQALVLYTDDVRKFIALANELLHFIQ